MSGIGKGEIGLAKRVLSQKILICANCLLTSTTAAAVAETEPGRFEPKWNRDPRAAFPKDFWMWIRQINWHELRLILHIG